MFAVAIWFGLLTGIVYGGTLVLRQELTGRITWVSPHAIWMAPAAQIVLFLPLALLLVVVAQLAPRFPSFSASIWLFSFLSIFTSLLPYPQIARWSAALIAAGVATQLTRVLGPKRAPVVRGLIRSGVVLMLLVGLLGGGRAAWRSWQSRHGIDTLAAPGPGAPSVLMVVLDTAREMDLSLYGYGRPTTPALSRWASQGAVFERAISTAPWTLPSHGTLFSGAYPWQLSGDWRIRDDGRGVMLAELFQARGYRTAGFVANLLYTSYETGLARGFLEYDDYPLSFHQILLHSPVCQTALFTTLVRARSVRGAARELRKFNLGVVQNPGDEYRDATNVTGAFLDWQAGLGDRPFFAFLNYFDAHGPYRSPERFKSAFAAGGGDRDRYDASIAYLDSEVDRLLSALAKRGALDHTIVVIVADHGEQFGEHKLTGHANSLYLPLLHVPLIVRYPARVPAGIRIAQTVSLRDVGATILDLAGAGQASSFPGSSLMPLVSHGDTTGLSPVISELSQGINVNPAFPNAHSSMASLIDGSYHYIRNDRGAEELYAWRTDSLELSNLASSPALSDTLLRLRERIRTLAPPGTKPE